MLHQPTIIADGDSRPGEPIRVAVQLDGPTPDSLMTNHPSLDAPVGTPIELRLWNPRMNGGRGQRFVFTLWVDGHGIIRHSLDDGRGGSSQSVSNLQLKEIVPKKAVPGWQVEAVAAAGSGLYDVEEIR